MSEFSQAFIEIYRTEEPTTNKSSIKKKKKLYLFIIIFIIYDHLASKTEF